MTRSTEPGSADVVQAAGSHAVRASQGRVPDFFIVGHPKSGTTALYEMLRRHPQIYMPDLKEPDFLAPDQTRRGRAAHELPSTLEEYLALFTPAGREQRVGEASSAYLVSGAAPSAIAELQPSARIIAILREPASLLRSLHLQLLQSHIESEPDLRKALALEAARREGRRIPRRSPRPRALLYSERVRFVEQLRRYYAVFPGEQMLVLIYDDFRRENEATVQRVLRFLGVDDRVAFDVMEANPTVRMRSQQLDEIVRAVSVGRGALPRALKATVKALSPRGLRRRALEVVQRRVVLAPPQPPDEGLMLELRRRYKPEVVAVSEFLGRDLVSLWGYDEID